VIKKITSDKIDDVSHIESFEQLFRCIYRDSVI